MLYCVSFPMRSRLHTRGKTADTAKCAGIVVGCMSAYCVEIGTSNDTHTAAAAGGDVAHGVWNEPRVHYLRLPHILRA